MLFQSENQITEFQKLLFANPFTPAMEGIKENYTMGFLGINECRCQLLDEFLTSYKGVTTNDLIDKVPADVYAFVQGIGLECCIGVL